uniref:MICOS complex subunit n=1 Tax=Heterorhabditis bacteriophora TaxID=37862 RepID=A0A1I7X473_HETBA
MTVEDEPLVSKISQAKEKVGNVFSQWWTLTTAEKMPSPDARNLTTIKDVCNFILPVYAEDAPKNIYNVVEDEPLPLQREFATVRKAFNTECERFKSRCTIIDKALTKTKSTVNNVNHYVYEEWTVLPKAAVITIGGMAGFVLGLKKGRIVRILTSSTGMLTMATFCYPHEAVDVIRTGIHHTEHVWQKFQQGM